MSMQVGKKEIMDLMIVYILFTFLVFCHIVTLVCSTILQVPNFNQLGREHSYSTCDVRIPCIDGMISYAR